MDTLIHFILNTFSNKTYSLLSGQDSQAAMSPGLNGLDDTMTDLQNIHCRLRYAPPSVYTEDPS